MPAGVAWPCARASPSNPASLRAIDKGQTRWARQPHLGDSPEASTGHTGQEHPFLKVGPKQEIPKLFSRVLLALGASDRLLRLRPPAPGQTCACAREKTSLKIPYLPLCCLLMKTNNQPAEGELNHVLSERVRGHVHKGDVILPRHTLSPSPCHSPVPGSPDCLVQGACVSRVCDPRKTDPRNGFSWGSGASLGNWL